jgi:hypothetical protein
MNRKDLIFILIAITIFLPFILINSFYQAYASFNHDYPMIMSMIKFAILATLGEALGSRIKSGEYTPSGFGLFPRAFVWAILGFSIKLAFVIFTAGTIDFLSFMGMDNVKEVYAGGFTAGKLFIAFCISFFMNTIFGPVMMTTHKVTDTHILLTGGTMSGLFSRIKVSEILKNINWDVQWNFVFKKSIPLFWYPAHTITFLLPQEYQVLFAAFLSIALGLILAIASVKGRNK